MDYSRRQDRNGLYGQSVSPPTVLHEYVCIGRGRREKAQEVRESEKKQTEGELYCRETWIMLWTVDAAVAAAVFQIALNSQRLCGMNE